VKSSSKFFASSPVFVFVEFVSHISAPLGIILGQGRKSWPTCRPVVPAAISWLSGRRISRAPLFRGRRRTGTAEIDRMAATTSSSPVSATVLIRRQSLNNAIACQHTSIHGKVPTNHECPHGCVLLSQSIGFVREISLVLSPIDKH